MAYQPDPAPLDALLARLLDQAAPVILVDNGGAAAYLADQPAQRARIQYRSLGANQGLGAALNAGFELAAAQGCAYVATFDQDSLPPPGMLDRLQQAHEALAHRGVRCAAVGPCFYDSREAPPRLYPLYKERRGRIVALDAGAPADDEGSAGLLEVDTLITSGMLVSLAAWRAGLAYDPGFFVDYTDTDWCFRARAAGWRLYAHPGARMAHALSDAPPVRVLGVNLLRYSPLRRYYYFRNSVRFVRRPYVSWAWRRRLLLGLAVRLVANPWIDAQGAASLAMALRGLRDGLRRGKPAAE